jgi:hypothetical protein
VDAFHQVRDIGLSGKIPLVFWDEFDTTFGDHEFGWLRYFLAPMQDGAFQQGQITHPIGRAIFVFAGGIIPCMEEFGKHMDETELTELKQRKVPDFVSRLKGYINILGPDPQDEPERDRTTDQQHLIRRAIYLRVILGKNAEGLFENPGGKGELSIDPGVLRAFLRIGKFKHGVRSMDSIVAMSMLTGKSRFQRSDLPSEPQLDLHVNGREFISLVQAPELEGNLLEKLAKAAHEVHCKGQEGKPDAPETARMSYEELPEHYKESNRGNVRDIPVKLEAIGYVMLPARSEEPPFDFPGADLDKLSEMEHNRWLREKLAAGWRWGEVRNDVEKTNPAMLLWRGATEEEIARLDPGLREAVENGRIGREELPEHEKEKDRELVREIPTILAEAGYAIVKLEEGNEA